MNPGVANRSTSKVARSALRPLALAVMASLLPAVAAAQSDAQRIAELERRILQLEARLNALVDQPARAPAITVDPTLAQEVKILKRKLEIKDEEAAAALPNTPVVTAGERGFALESRDKAWVFKLRALLHTDSREYFSDGNLADNADNFLFRRVRPTFEGTLFGIYDFKFMPDFAGGRAIAVDAYADARFSPAFKLRVGKFKSPVGLERLQSASDIRLIERGLPTGLAPNRDIGIQLHGDVLDKKLNYAVGIFGGVADGGSSDSTADADNNGDKEIAARLFLSPFNASNNFNLRGLSFGLAGTTTDHRGSSSSTLLPTYRSPGQQNVFGYRTGTTATIADGRRLRLSPQATYYNGAFGALGEYITVSQDVSRNTAAGQRRAELEHESWQLQLSYVLTGEEASFGGIKPKTAYKVGGPGWGAVELVGRYQVLDIDADSFSGGAASFADPSTSISKASAYALGVNWWFNRNIKWVLNYEHTQFDGGATGSQDRPDEKALFGRLQLSF